MATRWIWRLSRLSRTDKPRRQISNGPTRESRKNSSQKDNVARDHEFSAIHSLSDRPRPEEPWPKDRSDTIVLTVLLLSHDMYAAILLPASFVVLGADRIFFAEADGVELAARDAGVHEIVLGGFGARITESDV